MVMANQEQIGNETKRNAPDKKSSYLEQDNLRLEIAVLQERIQAFIPAYAKFKIPAILEDNIVEIYVPYHYTFDWGSEWVEPGTKFLVCSAGADLNDLRMIGRYDWNKAVPNPSHKLAQYIIQLIMLKEREQAIFDFNYMNDLRVLGCCGSSPIWTDVGAIVPNNYPRLDYELFEGPDIDPRYGDGVLYA